MGGSKKVVLGVLRRSFGGVLRTPSAKGPTRSKVLTRRGAGTRRTLKEKKEKTGNIKGRKEI